jgi:hypothetical protein
LDVVLWQAECVGSGGHQAQPPENKEFKPHG